MAMIGRAEPAWRGIAYVDGEERHIGFTDYTGKWHVLYWYPLDFTFVCPTEIKGFQALLGDFAREGVAVIGASTDSFYSHQHWFADRETFPEPITHAILADSSHAVSRAFDVLKEDEGVAYRATVVVDDQGVIRSLALNDLSVGRSPGEVLRTVQALQSGGLCGADWHQGERFAG
jgi:peroxiredoxin (alkyl hydroperoxide reductase subunit C)